jgi:hypothetical protein
MAPSGARRNATEMPPSLCLSCTWKREVVSGRGSRFLLCRRSATNPSLPKYPIQPVLDCPEFEPRPPDQAGDDEPGDKPTGAP